MKILALECAGSACSAALYLNGELRQQIRAVATAQHSQQLLPMQHALLDEAGIRLADLDLLACGQGPGSFTGVRVAVAVTQGLALGAELPVLGLSSLACMAYGAARDYGVQKVLVAQDARMREIYWAEYDFRPEKTLALRSDCLTGPDALVDYEPCADFAVGSAWSQYPAQLAACAGRFAKLNEDYLQQARDVAELAALQVDRGERTPQSPADLQPVYLRNQVVDQASVQGSSAP